MKVMPIKGLKLNHVDILAMATMISTGKAAQIREGVWHLDWKGRKFEIRRDGKHGTLAVIEELYTAPKLAIRM